MKKPVLSSARILAQQRNFTILRLRGMWAGFHIIDAFTTTEQIEGKKIIDEALSNLNAETESSRWNKIYGR